MELSSRNLYVGVGLGVGQVSGLPPVPEAGKPIGRGLSDLGSARSLGPGVGEVSGPPPVPEAGKPIGQGLSDLGSARSPDLRLFLRLASL